MSGRRLRKKLIVFLRAPRIGNVKTRLAASIGDEAALAAYKRIAEELLKNLNGLSDVQIRFSPDDAETEIRGWIGDCFEFSPQGKGDLGERLQRAFQENFSRGWERVVIIGSDCPDVALTDVETAWHSLTTCDVVLGPATDGGYWLIGLSCPRLSLFQNISWSTGRVLEETLGKISTANLSHRCLRTRSDIDTASDWQRYEECRTKQRSSGEQRSGSPD